MMRAVSFASALALYVGFLDATSAFLVPFHTRGGGEGAVRGRSSTTRRIAVSIGTFKSTRHPHHRQRRPTTRDRDTVLHAAEESTAAAAAAQAAFMSAAPLLLAPLAALAYGSQALTAKEQLELDLAATEIRLQDIKEQSRRSQLQATSSFALALASAGIVAFNTFGDIATRTAAGGASGTAFFDQAEKNEVLLMSPGQESSANKLLEKIESSGAGTSGAIADWSSIAATPSDTGAAPSSSTSTASAIVAEPMLDEETKQSGVVTSGSAGDEAKTAVAEESIRPDAVAIPGVVAESMDDVTDSVENSMEEIVTRLKERLAEDSVPGEGSKPDELGSETPPPTPQNEFEPMIAFPGPDRVEDSDVASAVTSTDELMAKDDDAQKEEPADTVMSKLEAAMKSFMSKSTDDLRPTESAVEPSANVELSDVEAANEPAIVDDAQVDNLMAKLDGAVTLPEPVTPTEGQSDAQVDDVMSKVDETMNKVMAKSALDRAEVILSDEEAGTAVVENLSPDQREEISEPPKSFFENLMTRLGVATEEKEADKLDAKSAATDVQVDNVMSKLDEAMSKFAADSVTNDNADSIVEAPVTAISPAIEEGRAAEDIFKDEGFGVSSDVVAESLSPAQQDETPEPAEPPKSFFETLMTRLGVTTDEKEAGKVEATGSSAADAQVDSVMSKLDETMGRLKPDSSLVIGEDAATGTIFNEEVASPSPVQMDETPESVDPAVSTYDKLSTKLETAMEEREADKTSSTVSVPAESLEGISEPAETESAASTYDNLLTKLETAMEEREADKTASTGSVPAESLEGISEPAETESIFDNLMTKLETAMEEKNAETTAEELSSSLSIVPDEVISSEAPAGTDIGDENAQDGSPAVAIEDGMPTPAMEELADDSLSNEEAPVGMEDEAPVVIEQPPTIKEEDEAPVVADDEAPAIVEELPPVAKEDNEEALVENNVGPATEALPETTLSPPALEEPSMPILTLPAIQTPSASAPSVIRITGLENMDPAVYQTAAAIAAGAVLVGILASVGDDTATMPVGQKEEKSTYLDGLTRSSATSSGAKPDVPSGYLDTLKASSGEVAKAAQSPQAPRPMGTGSYLENLTSKQPPGPGYGLNNGVTGQSVTPPVETKPPPAKPLTVTNASQYVASSKPPEDPRASIPKSQFSPATERPIRPATVSPAVGPPREVSRQRVPEPKKTTPGLSYLETMAQGSSGPRRVPPPANRNDLGNVRKIDTQPPRSFGTGPPPRIEPPKAVPGLSYLERMNQAAPSSGFAQPSSLGTGQPSKVDPPKAVPGTSYLERMNQSAPSNGSTQPPSSFGTGPPPKIDAPKAVPGLSYLERMNQATTSNSSTQPYGSSYGTGQPPYSNGRAAASSPPPFQQAAAPPGAQWNSAGPRAPLPPAPFQSFADSLARQNGQMAGPPAGQTNSNVGPPGGVSPPFQSFTDSLSRQNGQQQQQRANAPQSPPVNTADRMTQTNVGSIADKPKPKAPAGFGSYLDTL